MEWTERKKMLISGAMALLAAALAVLARRPWSLWAALGMLVSSVGDGLLAGYPGCFRRVKNKFVKGGAVFWAAHCLYILALARASGQGAGSLLPAFAPPFLAFAALTAAHGYVFYFRAGAHVSRGFFLAAMGYLLTVSAHAAAAVCVFGQTGGHFALNAVGAALFYLSDAVLLARRFGAKGKLFTTDVIWLTYIPAQLCLMLGFFIA